MRVIAFALANADGQGDYYGGLASRIPNSCAADDDFGLPLGDPRETSVGAAISFRSSQACTTSHVNHRTASASRRSDAPAPRSTHTVSAKPTTYNKSCVRDSVCWTGLTWRLTH